MKPSNQKYMADIPSLRRILSLKSHLEAHTYRKSILNSLQIFVQPNDILVCPAEGYRK
jgi:hypothetical protein